MKEDIIETSELKHVVGLSHGALVAQATGWGKTGHGELIHSDMDSPEFWRGYLQGLTEILSCNGIPKFLSGEALGRVEASLNILFENCKLEEFLSEKAKTFKAEGRV